ncbi:IL27B protein, partial [Atractosteus spatula]|nr:IL27B protein [Atractosteus spatula]
LHLGSLPQLDVQCMSPSYPQRVLCTWKVQPEPDLPTFYTATYRKGLVGVQIPCEVDPERPRLCVIENLEMFSVEPYFVNVTATNALGSTTRLLPFILEKIGQGRGWDRPHLAFHSKQGVGLVSVSQREA